MKSINKTALISSPTDQVWNAFTQSKKVDAWGGGPSDVSDHKGKEIMLFGGKIRGKRIDVDQNLRIIDEWRDSEWEPDTISTVTILLTPIGSDQFQTSLEITHTGVPESAYDHYLDLWDEVISKIQNYLSK